MTFFQKFFWSPLHDTSDKWDTEFNYLMDNHKFFPKIRYDGMIDVYIAKLGEYEIWITNYQYAVFVKWENNKKHFNGPKLNTIIRAKEKLINDYTEWFVENKPIQHFSKKEMRKVYHEWLVSKLFK
jgi:hypothetical protein